MTLRINQKIGCIFACFSFLFFCLFLLSANAFAQDPNYKVESVVASATAQNPFEARNVAIADARRRAFKILLRNLGIKTDAHTLFDDQEISQIIRSQQVDGERIAGNEYFASLNIIFDEEFFEHIISQKNLKSHKIDKKVENQLILPAKKIGNHVYFWGEKNNWKTAIENNIRNGAGQIFKAPEPSIDNLAAIDEVIFFEPKFQDIAEIADKHDVSSTYTLVYSYDKDSYEAYVDITYLQNIHRRRFRLNFINTNALDEKDLLDVVARKTIEYLLKQDNKLDFSDDGKKYIGIPITSLGHWLMIKNKLEAADFLGGLEVKMIARDFAIVAAFYEKPQVAMESDFLSIGLIVNKKSYNYYSAITMN